MKSFIITIEGDPHRGFHFTHCFWFILILCSSFSNATEHYVVMTPSGLIRGNVDESVLRPDVKFVSFLGLPYAQPPLGEYRFKESVPAEPWQDVFDATEDSQECLQINIKDTSNPVGDENCLFLNVYMPLMSRENDAPLRPVIAYIHGGGFSKNAGTSEHISPDYLVLANDIILVTMNYRLHLFGFLYLDIPECNGNMGLRDQVLALQWIQKHIMSFGGDPGNVTLMGQSAGAHSAYLHTLSPMSRGLFHKVIMHSPIMPKVISKEPELYSLKFALYLGYEGDLSNRLMVLQFIDSFDGRQLTEAFAKFMDELNETDFKYYYTAQPFKPATDLNDKDSFLPKPLVQLADDVPAIPIIMGSTSMDGAIAFAGNDIREVISYVDEHLEVYLDPKFTVNEHVKQDVIARVKEFYFKGKKMDENALTETINLYTDLLFYHFDTYNSFLQASLYANKIYNYHFCYDGSLEFYKKRYLGEEYYRTVEGAVHTQDISYLFYSPKNYPDLQLSDDDLKVISMMCTWWTNFAKTGDPNSDTDDIDIVWAPICPDCRSHLEINKDSRFVAGRIHEERHQFWDELALEMISKDACSRSSLLRRWLRMCDED